MNLARYDDLLELIMISQFKVYVLLWRCAEMERSINYTAVPENYTIYLCLIDIGNCDSFGAYFNLLSNTHVR